MLPGGKGVSSPQRELALLTLTKTGGATPALGGLCAKFCSIVRTGAGVYEVTVNTQRPFNQIVQAQVTAAAVGFATVDTALTDKFKVTVKTFAVAGTAADLDFQLLVVGSYAIDLLG